MVYFFGYFWISFRWFPLRYHFRWNDYSECKWQNIYMQSKMENFISSFMCQPMCTVCCLRQLYTLHIMTSRSVSYFPYSLHIRWKHCSIVCPFWMLSWTPLASAELIAVQLEQFDTMGYSCYCQFLLSYFWFEIYWAYIFIMNKIYRFSEYFLLFMRNSLHFCNGSSEPRCPMRLSCVPYSVNSRSIANSFNASGFGRARTKNSFPESLG